MKTKKYSSTLTQLQEDVADASSGKGNWIQFFVLALTAVGVLVAIAAWIYPNARKELSVIVKNSRPMLLERSSLGDGVAEVLIGGVKVDQPWLLSLRVENTGNIPILPGDVESPLSIHVPGVNTIVANVSSRSDQGIQIEFQPQKEWLVLKSSLLNSRDWIDVDLLVSGAPTGPVDANARISGVHRVELINESEGGREYRPAVINVPLPLAFPLAAMALACGVLIFLLGGTLLLGAFISPLQRSTNRVMAKNGYGISSPTRINGSSELVKNVSRFLPYDFGYIDGAKGLADKLNNIDSKVFEVYGVTPENIANLMISETRDQYIDGVRKQIDKLLTKEGRQKASLVLNGIVGRAFHVNEIESQLMPVFDRYSVKEKVSFRGIFGAVGAGISVAGLGVFIVLLSFGALQFWLKL